MPIFHCPMGAPYYEAENCILCGLCLATTKEDMVIATKKIREYLRSRPEKKTIVRKIAVCGKGGVGKSTIVTLMARAMAKEDYTVLVLDMDESNPGLFRMFGFDKQPKPLITILRRFSEDAQISDTEWLRKDEIFFQDIPPEYTLDVGNLKFIMVGKIADPLEGCACSMADVTRELMGKLRTKEKEIVVVDMEAGIESFGRGVERNVDAVLIIVEPSFESIALAEKIDYMADGIGVGKVRAVLNKIPSEEIEIKILEQLEKKEIKPIGTVHLDSQISEANFQGEALGDSQAKVEIRQIVLRLLDELRV
jgi:CO dehydrogenase maturation factor